MSARSARCWSARASCMSEPALHPDDIDPADEPFAWLRRLASSSFVLGVVSLVLIAVLWQLAVMIFPIKPYILPSPIDVGLTIYEQRAFQFEHSIATLREVLLGFALAVVIGIPIAIV